MSMRTATTIEASSGPWRDTVDFAVEAEKLGLDVCWVAEAWGSDAVSALGFLAARTDRMLLGSGVLQVGTRSPVAVAQAAWTLADMSDGRFLLGLGASGPQVMEGLHGVAFARPLSRVRETVEIVRSALAGERVSHSGRAYTIPLPGEARAMRLSTTPNPDIPLYLATMSPKMLESPGRSPTAGSAPASSPRAPRAPTSPTSTPGTPRPAAPAPTSTSARAPRSVSPPTRTSSP